MRMKRKSEGIKPMKNVFGDLMKIYGMDHKFTELKVKEIWEEKMGAAIANKTNKIVLFNGILSIYLDSGVLKQEFSYAKEKIKNMMNENLGQKVIKKVEIY